MDYGWIRLHRKITENPLYFSEPFTRIGAWIDLILIANHKEGFIYVRGNRVVIGRGQVGMSQDHLAQRWKWSRGKVIRFLDELEKDNQIEQQKNRVTTLISIIKYNNYQSSSTIESTTDDQQIEQQTDDRQYTNKNERIKRIKKNEKNTPLIPKGEAGEALEIFELYSFEEFWNDYDKKVGDKEKLKKKWAKISVDDRSKIKSFIPEYLEAVPEKQYRKDPSTFLNNKSWNDEIIRREVTSKKTDQPMIGRFNSHKEYFGLDGPPKKTNLPPAFKCAEQYD